MWAAPSHEEEISVVEILHTGGALQCLLLSLEQDAPSDFSLGAGAWELVLEGHPSQEGKAPASVIVAFTRARVDSIAWTTSSIQVRH